MREVSVICGFEWEGRSAKEKLCQPEYSAGAESGKKEESFPR